MEMEIVKETTKAFQKMFVEPQPQITKWVNHFIQSFSMPNFTFHVKSIVT